VLLVVLLVGAGVAGLANSRLRGPPDFTFDASVARAGKAIAGHEAQFLDDQAYLASHPLFAPRKGARDAGSVIGPRIHWVRVRPGTLDYPALSDDAIDRGLYDKLGADWLDAPPERWSGLDFGWMAQLAQQDFWDLERNSISDPDDLLRPEPLSSDLFAWAELRLARGLHENALPAAVAEVQELARLCFTTEHFATHIAGIALLASVNEAQKKSAGSLPWAELGRIQRSLFGAQAFARLETPPQYAPDFDKLVVGRCAALGDGAWTALLTRAELVDSHPEEYRRLESLLVHAPECRLRRIRERWALPDEITLKDRSGWDGILWRWSPAWRRFHGETLVAIGALDWFKGYDRAPAAK
jgi:hypothetical protein